MTQACPAPAAPTEQVGELTPDGLQWRKSTYSATSNCVEVCIDGEGTVQVRNSRHPDRPHLTFTPTEWQAFLDGVRAGEFDLVGEQDGPP